MSERSGRDLYREAIKEGDARSRTVGFDILEKECASYWTARYAARQTASALLNEAKKIGVTDEQWESLRKVAADVAYD